MICKQDKRHTFASYDPTQKIIALSGEKELWREVLCAAIESANSVMEETNIPTLGFIRSLKDPEEKRRAISRRAACLERRRKHEMERDSSRRFIMREDDMFDKICEWLELPAKKCREGIMKQWE